MTRRREWIAIAGLLVAVVVWGASFVATKLALRDVSPLTVVWLRFAIGLPVLVIAARLRGDLRPVGPRALGYFALLGLIGISFHQWVQSNGLVTSGASTAAWIVATSPVFIALLGRVFLGEHLAWGRAAGIALAAGGVALVVRGQAPAALAAGRWGTPGDWWLLVSSLNWAVFSVLSRRGLTEYPAAQMLLYVMGSGLAFTSCQFLAAGGPAEIAQLTAASWWAVGFLGVLCSGVAYILWYDGLRVLSAARAGAFLYCEPVVALGVAAVVLGERVRGAALAGGALILVGVWIVNRPESEA